MKVDGHCHCGNIRYAAEVDPRRVFICHCTDCQNLTGSAFRVTVPAPAATFTLLSGQPKTYIKTAESGARRAHAFCPDRGAPVYSSALENTPSYSLRLGCLTQRSQLMPAKQNWCDSALPWVMHMDVLEKNVRQ